MIANKVDTISLKEDGSNKTEVENRDNRRREVLLSVIGPTTYSLLRNLVSPAKPAEKSYTDLIKALKNHYAPTLSTTVQSFKFQARVRNKGESVASYISELRKLAEHCEFGAGLDERLRDQFISGIADETVQKKLLSRDVPTFAEANKIALSHEIANRDVSIFSPTQNTPTSNSVNKVKSSTMRRRSTHPNTPTRTPTRTTTPSTHVCTPTASGRKPTSRQPMKRQCFRCGRPDHLAPDCPMKDRECHYCHKIGYLAHVCFAKNKNEKVYNVNENDPKSENEDETGVFSVSEDARDKPIMINVQINGKDMMFQEDSGSGHTLMNIAEFKQKFPDVSISKTEVKLKTYTGHKIEVVGEAKVNISRSGNEFELPIVITKEGPTLVGRIWLNTFALLDSNVNTVLGSSLYEDIIAENASLSDNSTVWVFAKFRSKNRSRRYNTDFL